jgi:hypothetical protein
LLQGQAGEDSTDGRKTVEGVGEEKMSMKFGMVWDQSSDKFVLGFSNLLCLS